MTVTETILDKILVDKKQEVEHKRRLVPLDSLKEAVAGRPKPVDFKSALEGKDLKLIAEVKKASPSKGVLKQEFDPVALAVTYQRSGAAAVSVLTDEKYFQGNLEYLSSIRRHVHVPLLRKDFIYDEYQVYESVTHGADAILLIVAMLDQERLESLLELSHSLRLYCLVEVHNENELMTALLAGAGIIGINNRDLKTFEVDTNTTRRLRLLIPEDCIVVSESGIKDRNDIRKLKECKVNAVLIGEALVTAEDIPAKIKEVMA